MRLPRILDWMFFLGYAPVRAFEPGREGVHERAEGLLYRYGPEFDSEPVGQQFRVNDAALRRELGGHGDANHVVAAQRVHSYRGDQAGVYSARQRDQNLAEAALSHVVAGSYHKGLVYLLSAVIDFPETPGRGLPRRRASFVPLGDANQPGTSNVFQRFGVFFARSGFAQARPEDRLRVEVGDKQVFHELP